MKITTMMILGTTAILSGCGATKTSQTHPTPVNSTSHIQKPALTEGHDVVYFIRGKDAIQGPAVNVFVDGHFVTSLLPGNHRALSMCSRTTNITAAFTDPHSNYNQIRQRKNPYALQEGKVYYFSVEADEYNKPYFQQLTEQEAEKLLKYTREAVRTLSRLPNNICVKEAPPPVLKRYTISTNALFDFSKADRQHLLSQRKQQLAQIAKEIRKDESQIGFIAVLGHSDPVGSDAVNRRLSQQRAETVRSLLIDHGLSKKDILAEGRGKDELIIHDCAQRFASNTTALNQCNLPNRRVEVITYGLKVQ